MEEDDYESDPELTMRRRKVASDDEDDETEAFDGKYDTRVSDSDYEGQYDDCDVAVVDDVEAEVGDDVAVEGKEVVDDVEVECDDVEVEGDDVEVEGEEVEVEGEEVEGGEKKEKEPFAVPTTGAFYMHDDRFRGNVGGGGRGRGGGRNRRTLGGSKLWETKDDRKWGHDKFEELTVQERPYNEGRRGQRGRNRGRGRNKGEDREYLHGNMTKSQDQNYQNSAPKSVRGRGPRRYQPVWKRTDEAPANSRRPSKSLEKSSHANTEKASAATSISESTQVSSSRNMFASSLSSASPPFYPSASSNQEINTTQKGNTQSGHVSRSNNMRESNVSDTLGMEKLHIDDSVASHQARNKGRGQTGQRVYQPVQSHNQANRIPSQNKAQTFQRTPNFHPSSQQLKSRSASESLASSPPKVSGPSHLLESALLESYNSKMALVNKEKGGIQSNRVGSFPFAGNTGGNHGDQNFPGALGNHGDKNFPGGPTFLPVMQFAGQQHRGGIPAVGMAFPGYVGQPNGMGNSEMTWLPVLAGAARGLGATGAMGAQYCPPYISMDGSYHAQTSGQVTSLTPALSKDSNINEPGNKVKPSQRSEFASDELGQRQNKARRYTEMKFDQ